MSAEQALHPAGEQDHLPALAARVLQLEATVAALRSLAADAYRAEGRPVPPPFAGAPPLAGGFRPRDHLRLVKGGAR